MEIKNVEIKTMDDVDLPHHLKPTLRVYIEISYTNSQEVILDVSGNLLINNTILSSLKIDDYGGTGETRLIPAFPEEGNNDSNDTPVYLKGYAELDKESIDFIEKSRSTVKNKNVNFSVSLNVSYLENKALISYVVEYKLDEKDDKSIFKQYKQDIIQNIKSQYMSTPFEIKENDISFLLYSRPVNAKNYRSIRDNIHLISGNYDANGKGEYIAHNRITRSFPCTIKSSDWVNDYAPRLGIGNFLVLEIPFYKNSDNDIINIALNLIDEAEKAYRAWDAKTVLSNCRDAVTLLEKTINKDSDAWKKFHRIVEDGERGLFGFLSLGGHRLPRNKGSDDEAKPLEIKDLNPEVKQYDAEAALYFTKILVKYTAELLNGNMVG